MESAFGMLMALMLHRKRLHYEQVIQLSTGKCKVGELLNSQAFFLSRPPNEPESQDFYLMLPEFHLRAAKIVERSRLPAAVDPIGGCSSIAVANGTLASVRDSASTRNGTEGSTEQPSPQHLLGRGGTNVV
jgi:hypothetical protein